MARDGRGRPRCARQRREPRTPPSPPSASRDRCTARRCSTTRDEVVRPALLWCDQRTGRRVPRDHRSHRRGAPDRAGVRIPALTGFTLPKLLWVRRHEPELWARVRSVLLPEGLRPLPPHRRARHRRRRRLGHAALRRGRTAVVDRRSLHAMDVDLDAAAARLRVARDRRAASSAAGAAPPACARAHRWSPAAAIRRPAPSAWASCSRAW